nr:glutaredoxin-C11-like [Tanacetum cinerariifolium]
MLANEIDEGTHTLMQTEQEATQPDQSNFAYPAYEPPNVPAYPYLYVPYLHPYTHYPDASSPSFVGDHYRAHGDGYHACSIVPSSGYEIEGSSTGFHEEDFDLIMHSEDYVESNDDEIVKNLASKSAAVIFTKSSCCMCHSIKALFYELGASPAIHEVDNDADMEWALRLLGSNPAIPAVFIGGKYIGSAKDVITLHVDGSLKQKLIEALAYVNVYLKCLLDLTMF